jgi:hypothetical protein
VLTVLVVAIAHHTGRLTDNTPFSTVPTPLQLGICGRNLGKPPPEAPLFTQAQIAGIVIGTAVGLMGACAIAHRLATARLHKAGDAMDEAKAQPNRPRPVSVVDMDSARIVY